MLAGVSLPLLVERAANAKPGAFLTLFSIHLFRHLPRCSESMLRGLVHAIETCDRLELRCRDKKHVRPARGIPGGPVCFLWPHAGRLAWAGISYSMPHCLLRVPGVDQIAFCC